MCGFAGCLTDRTKADQTDYDETVHEMTKMMVHRGPDDSGYFADDKITMGFRRLSIIDLDGGHQPLSYENERYWLTYNGEIYNYLELREGLLAEGYEFKTDSDSEVILGMYAKYHDQLTTYLRGMFAFVIWDKQEQTLFAARDQFGIKPFYYALANQNFYYASESKAIYKILKAKTFDKDALQDYMTFQYVPETATLTKEIKQLAPGCTLTKKVGSAPVIKRYYHREFHPVPRPEAVYAKKIKETLFDSVKIHMRSDVPVGAFLSGGIDSSIVVAMAKQFNPNLQTISVGFEREGYSELDVAQETAEQLGVDNFSMTITPETFMKAFPHFVWSMDEPLADPAAVPQYFLTKEARKHVKVALTGEGADELFGGYTIYHEPESLKAFQYTKPINGALNRIGAMMPAGMRGRSFLLRGTTPLAERYVGNAFIFNEAEKQRFFKNYDQTHPFQNVTRPFYEESVDYDPISRMQFIDMHTWLNGDLLHNADRTALAHSLELRTPFVDREVYNLAAEIPADLRISHGTTKYILRKAVEDVVPAHVLHRKKLGFPVPIRFWLKDEMYDWARQIINESQTDDYFDKGYFLKLLDDHRDGVADNSRKLWTILTFMMWHKIYVESDTLMDSVTANAQAQRVELPLS
ncbi:asparagine synthase (glutamine-hydrolyzing) [Lactiplantibacillus mudanjiangensis]|uniref:asparagine synthase (glutamine-hydrolyzing) n=1 Tax=Lactiplantibacillus mudanjiangensis TaxID=1296538 RepID=A0A660E623_9LACO|nr:asparagine synthase (glutamine-hydrolyzing) [Lactiplantibacillus mudanjiangensis]VDG20216.1 asparagine synthase (glutamine-hydrolysing) [Lactobacillus plantarum JDM1] [Lactiplantibacillus mudanjiangensis]VDG24092.1 asparagine synthase (glutamine-hydrolysing) [Lactobacillus plantarum JDM1] [Lactiplantibacillus mudanjiangensis]VDG30269.1 asparagine synthase (glutamine-hydrolysing) [Lactobacillus plantarum JDM1] [Lactiplantibacillus mudanjiangensis]VDG33810.1 asparagine synthase (glutamine-hydr